MPKLKITSPGKRMQIKCKLSLGEKWNDSQRDTLQRYNIQGLMQLDSVKGNTAFFVGTADMPLEQYLNSNITKEAYFRLIMQMANMIRRLEHYKLPLYNLQTDSRWVYINCSARAPLFVYEPIVSSAHPADIKKLLGLIWCAAGDRGINSRAIDEMHELLASRGIIKASHLEDYVMKYMPELKGGFVKFPGSNSKNADINAASANNANNASNFSYSYGKAPADEVPYSNYGTIDFEDLYGMGTDVLQPDDGGTLVDDALSSYEPYDNNYQNYEYSPYAPEQKRDEGEYYGTMPLDDDIDLDDLNIGAPVNDSHPNYYDTGPEFQEPKNERDGTLGTIVMDDYNGGTEPLETPDEEPGTVLLEENEQEAAPPRRQRTSFGVLKRVRNGQKIKVDKDIFRIGRSRSCDLCLEEIMPVSRSHAEIITRGGRFYVVDNDSKNGTFMDGVRLDRMSETEIRDGSRLRFADEDFEFHIIQE